MTVNDDLSKVIHELESGLLRLGQKYPELRQGMEEVANVIVELHGYIRKQDKLIEEARCVLKSNASLLDRVTKLVRKGLKAGDIT